MQFFFTLGKPISSPDPHRWVVVLNLPMLEKAPMFPMSDAQCVNPLNTSCSCKFASVSSHISEMVRASAIVPKLP